MRKADDQLDIGLSVFSSLFSSTVFSWSTSF